MNDETQYPQPHEGIKGTDLGARHLLSLDEASIDRRLTLLNRVEERWQDILYGRIADRDSVFDQMSNPCVGDMVMELTTRGRADRETRAQSFGILLVHKRKEWACTNEEWAQTVAEKEAERRKHGFSFNAEQFAKDRFADTASYVQYGPSPDDVCRWRNCMFVAVPEDLLPR